MITIFYLFVRLLATAYILYRLWIMLFGTDMFELWRRLFRTKEKCVQAAVAAEPPTHISETEILGKTQIVYLEDPEVAATVPTRSEKLPPSDFIGEEKDISPEDVEVVLLPGEARKILSDDELYDQMEDGAVLDPDFSSALTYEQMTNAVNVLTTSTDDEIKVMAAAQTLYTVRNTDMFEFFTAQVSNTEHIERLFEECLDGDGKPLPQRKSKVAPVVKFDWGTFV